MNKKNKGLVRAMNGNIIVVTHKDYIMPQDNLYFPICVGTLAQNPPNNYQSDNTGDNISIKNKTYCELTGIYWAWKNLMRNSNQDYIGVAHYRRHFGRIKSNSLNDVIKETDIAEILSENIDDKVIVTPARRYLSSIERHYVNSRGGVQEST